MLLRIRKLLLRVRIFRWLLRRKPETEGTRDVGGPPAHWLAKVRGVQMIRGQSILVEGTADGALNLTKEYPRQADHKAPPLVLQGSRQDPARSARFDVSPPETRPPQAHFHRSASERGVPVWWQKGNESKRSDPQEWPDPASRRVTTGPEWPQFSPGGTVPPTYSDAGQSPLDRPIALSDPQFGSTRSGHVSDSEQQQVEMQTVALVRPEQQPLIQELRRVEHQEGNYQARYLENPAGNPKLAQDYVTGADKQPEHQTEFVGEDAARPFRAADFHQNEVTPNPSSAAWSDSPSPSQQPNVWPELPSLSKVTPRPSSNVDRRESSALVSYPSGGHRWPDLPVLGNGTAATVVDIRTWERRRRLMREQQGLTWSE